RFGLRPRLFGFAGADPFGVAFQIGGGLRGDLGELLRIHRFLLERRTTLELGRKQEQKQHHGRASRAAAASAKRAAGSGDSRRRGTRAVVGGGGSVPRSSCSAE